MMPLLPKLIYMFNAIAIKMLVRIFIDTLILKLLGKNTRPRTAKNDLEKDYIGRNFSIQY